MAFIQSRLLNKFANSARRSPKQAYDDVCTVMFLSTLFLLTVVISARIM
jgi:hypothetical protein